MGEGEHNGTTTSLRQALERALASQFHSVDRLVHADTSVAFRLEGHHDVTLLLDRYPCQVTADSADAEVQIMLDHEQAERFRQGRLSLTAAIATGAVRTSGPVRKYLEVDPIVRRLLAGEDEGADTIREARQARRGDQMVADLDPDLLAIETRDLHKAFGPNKILQGLNLKIPEGSISVILGPSGTGKSVCLNHVIGLIAPDAGDVLIRGRPLSKMSRSSLLNLRRDIGVMFQDGALFSALNVYENVAFPLRQHTDFSDAEVRELVEEQLENVGLANAGDRLPNQLSGGMRKRAGLARAMVMNPGIVLCDEPDSGLDPVRTSLLGDLLMERHGDHGGTMVVVTHNVMLAKSIADHVSVIWRGEVLEDGMAQQILESDTPFIQQFLAGEARGPLGMDA